MSASGSAFWPGGSFLATCLDVWLMAQSLSQKDTWEKLGWGREHVLVQQYTLLQLSAFVRFHRGTSPSRSMRRVERTSDTLLAGQPSLVAMRPFSLGRTDV